VHRLLVTASVVPSSSILVTLMKEALSSSETSVITRATLSNIPEDVILHCHRRENLKSYIKHSRFPVDTVYPRRVLRLLVTANVVPSSTIFVTLMMEVIHSSETSVLRRPRRATSHKTAFFIVTAVKSSNSTCH
jgi:hypothetical protein